jgi:hypothetical protein
MSQLWSPTFGPSAEHAGQSELSYPRSAGAGSVGDDTVSHLHEALISSGWSQDAPPPHGVFPMEVTLQCNGTEPSILPCF